MDSKIIFALLVGSVVLLVFWLKPRTGFWIFFTSMFLPITAVERYVFHVATLLRAISYLFLVLLIAALLVRRRDVVWNFFRSMDRRVLIVIALFVVAGFIAGYYNGVSIMVTIFSFRWIVLLLGTMFCVFTLFPVEKREDLLRLLLNIGLLQLPVVIFQRVFMVRISGQYNPDVVCGVFPIFYNLVFFQIALILIVLGYQLQGKRLSRLPPTYIYLILVSTLVLSNAKVVWIYLPLCVLAMLLISSVGVRKLLQYSAFFGTFVMVGVILFDAMYQPSIKGYRYSRKEYLFNLKYIIEYNMGFNNLYDFIEKKFYQEDQNYVGRFGGIVYNYLLISGNPRTKLFGKGAVMKLESVQMTADVFVESNTPYILGNTISRTLGGGGFVGIGLLFLLWLALYRWSTSDPGVPVELQNVRRGIIFLIGLLLIYYNVIQSFQTAIILSVLFLNSRKLARISQTAR